MVIDGRMVKVLVWYDNEYGYVHRMAELVGKVAATMQPGQPMQPGAPA
jgi:glyceraldehyde 3-phosphate dehydrogenase